MKQAKAGTKEKLQATLEGAQASEKYVGVFPFEFDEAAGVATIPDTIHLIPIGEWEHDVYGTIVITAADIREFVQNFDAGIRKGVPITAGHEGSLELPAVGWITQVEARDDGLWGMVEWNEEGKELLSDKAFKFFSPEFYRDYEDAQNHEQYRNVLTGGALTKAPYFKELEAVVFSEKNIKKQFTTMNLKSIMQKKASELTPEEKAFLKAHKTEMSDAEQETFKSCFDEEGGAGESEEEKAKGDANEAAGLNRDGSAKAAPEKTAEELAAEAEKATGDANEANGLNRDGSAKIDASEKVLVSAGELAILRSKADQGVQALQKLTAAEVAEQTNKLVFADGNKNGKFLPKSKSKVQEFMITLSEAQRTKFAELINELPKATSELFSEKGANSSAAEGTAIAEVEAKVKVKQEAAEKAGKPMKYSDALKEVMSENEGLEQRYDEELPSGRRISA